MTELTLFDLNSSKDIVEELSQKESKLVMGGYPTQQETSTGGYSGGSSGDSSCTCNDDEELPDKLSVFDDDDEELPDTLSIPIDDD